MREVGLIDNFPALAWFEYHRQPTGELPRVLDQAARGGAPLILSWNGACHTVAGLPCARLDNGERFERRGSLLLFGRSQRHQNEADHKIQHTQSDAAQDDGFVS